MKLRSFLTVNAVVVLIYGVVTVLLPEFLGNVYGMDSSPSATMLSRVWGAALLFEGLVVWMSKDLAGASVRPILIGGLVATAVGFVVTLLATLDGTMNSVGWSGVIIYLVFGLGFAYYQFMGAPK
jgi:hypothetical protein